MTINNNIDSKSQRFENFLVAGHNHFAAATALAVANSPGIKYNPLQISAEKGLGKTHLLLAIGNAVKERNDNAQVRYIKAHDMVLDIAKAVENDTVAKYLDGCAATDCLLVDDIECMVGMEPEQDIFCQLIRKMIDNNKQVVLSCGWHPAFLRGFNDKLRWLFKRGRIADIGNPNMKSRVKMLRTLASKRGIAVCREALWVVAAAIEDDVGKVLRVFTSIVDDAEAQGGIVTLITVVKYVEGNKKNNIR